MLVTLAENASGMVRKNASKYIPLIGEWFIGGWLFYTFISNSLIWFQVPQILAMMVDLEDDPEWSVQDEIEDEDEER